MEKELDFLNLQIEDPRNKENQQLLNQLNYFKQRISIQSKAFSEGRILVGG